MNIEETGKLLARVQVIDNRRVDEATILAWHELVEDLDYAMAVEAVRLHFRESTTYLVPAHVRRGIERILLAGLGAREDDYGNTVDVDEPALAAHQRLTGGRAVTS